MSKHALWTLGLQPVLASTLNAEKDAAMAKGQKKSNKEVRKPKAEKPKPGPAGGFLAGSKTPVK